MLACRGSDTAFSDGTGAYLHSSYYGTTWAVARIGDPALDAGGATYSDFPFGLSYHAAADTAGVVAFTADLSGGAAAGGVFVIPEPGATPSWLAGAALLAALRARRRRAEPLPQFPTSDVTAS